MRILPPFNQVCQSWPFSIFILCPGPVKVWVAYQNGEMCRMTGHFLSSCHFRGMIIMKSNKNCFLVVAEGFDEKSIAQTAEFFCSSHVNLTVFSLYSSPSTYELAAKYSDDLPADLLLTDIEHLALPNGLIVAGGLMCGQHLMIDPRFHRLVKEMQQASRPVGFLYPIYIPFLNTIHRWQNDSQFMFQERLQQELFFNHFMYQMLSTSKTYQPQPAPLIL